MNTQSSPTKMCPLCPDYDTRYPISGDFFGTPCQINGVQCCEVCYNTYTATHEITEQKTLEEMSATLLADYESYSEPTQRYLVKKLWKLLCGKAREKGYSIYCGRFRRQFEIFGHRDGWPSGYFATSEEILRATLWLDKQGPALTEEEIIEQRRIAAEERKAKEVDYIQLPW